MARRASNQSEDSPPTLPPGRVGTGVQWLDVVLRGGLPANRVYLVVGDPGTGKTTLGLQFLIEGRRLGERCLFITLTEGPEELRQVAATHGMDLGGIEIFAVGSGDESGRPEEDYTVLHPSEIELGASVHKLTDAIERFAPQRVVVDSLAAIRLLAREPERYRRQITALKDFLMTRGCTALFTDTAAATDPSNPLETIAHGVLRLEQASPEYGRTRRRLQVTKMRGVDFATGYHDLSITTGGLTVWPRIVVAEHARAFDESAGVPSGVAELDRMMGGGPDRGTTMLVVGPTGAGKSTLAQQYLLAAAARGEHGVWFTFDEREVTISKRARSMGMDLEPHVRAGRIVVEQIDPGTLSPGELMHRVRRHVETGAARIVVFDSLNGYLDAMPGERYLVIQMHELLTYLAQMGVLSILVSSQPGILSSSMTAAVDMSYLADSLIVLRFFEHAGEVHRSIAVVKRREGNHERTIREFRLQNTGIEVGEPLRQFQGVLTGEPQYLGEAGPLMRPNGGGRDAPGAP